MRMTRAALRAQAQNTEGTGFQHDQENDHGVMSLQSRQSTTLIHEDQAEGDDSNSHLHNKTQEGSPVRLVLRDITDENYPQAESEVEADELEVYSTTPLRKSVPVIEDLEGPVSVQKSPSKGRHKAKGRTKKKIAGREAVEEQKAESCQIESLAETDSASAEILEHDNIASTEDMEELQIHPTDKDSKGIVESFETDQILQQEGFTVELAPSTSRTPRFDPALHPSNQLDAARTTEDSFISSIRKRSPAKLYIDQQSQISDSSSNILQVSTPIRRVSSTKFEDSFEAMDVLEDTIEQLTADLPLLPAGDMDMPDSPVKNLRQSSKPNLLTTPNTSAARTLKSTGRRRSDMLSLGDKDKENAPPTSRTPLSKSKTPVKAWTPRSTSTEVSRTKISPTKFASPEKLLQASVRKVASPDKMSVSPRKTTSSTTPATLKRKSVVLQSTSLSKAAEPSQRRLTQKQPLMNTTNTKKELPPKKSLLSGEKKTHGSSLSFPSSPAKSLPNMHKRRITSGGVLSTSKPGFVPAKSSKPPTISAFALPGEIIAEKLKAQKEAREEKMKQPKLSVAEQKAAKIKADREAREERVRLNQLKAQEAKAEKAKIAKAPVGQALTISKARAEAAERGRQASKEWAEKMQKKVMQQGVMKSGEATEMSSMPPVVAAS